MLGEQPQQTLGVGLDPILAGRPAVAGDDGRERGDVKVIFHVDREGVDLAGGARCGRGLSGESGTHGARTIANESAGEASLSP